MLKDVFVSIRKEYPSLMNNRESFFLTLQTLYDDMNASTLKVIHSDEQNVMVDDFLEMSTTRVV